MSDAGIMNLDKWAEKTAGAVRHVCLKKKAPCVGFALVFFDPMASEDEHWSFNIELAYDPNSPPGDEERAQIEKMLQYIAEGVKKIMGGDVQEPPEDFRREVRFN